MKHRKNLLKPCKICGSFNHEAKEAFCDECKKSVKKRFSDFVSSNFTKDEILDNLSETFEKMSTDYDI